MFQINEDMSIYVTRGDVVFFTVSADANGVPYTFKKDDVVRIKVTEKKNSKNVVLQKDFLVNAETEAVNITLESQDTKIGDVISKPVDYWYEVELNPFTNPQTIIGYDDDGAKIFKLFPEGRDLVDEPKEELPDVDAELSMTSTRPVQNQAVTRGMVELIEKVDNVHEDIKEIIAETIAFENIYARLDYDASNEALNIVLHDVASETGGAE